MTDRAALVSTIAFALTRCKRYFRTMVQAHNTDEARLAAAEIIADQIERSNLEVRQKGWCYLDGQGVGRGADQGGAGSGLPAVLGGPVRRGRDPSSTRAAVSGLLPAEIAGTRRGHGSLWSPSSARPSPLMCIPSGH